MADCKEGGILLRKSSDGKLSSTCQGELCLSVGMASTLLDGSVEDETLLLKNTYSEGTSLPVINESFIDQLKSGMDDSHLFPIFCSKSPLQKRNTANENNSQNSSWTNQTFTKKISDNSRTKEHELSSSSLDSTLNISGNKVQDIINTNPFKKPRDKKVKTSFALDTTQEENVSFEEEQQKYKQVESKTNPFKKNLKRKKFSVRFEKTLDSSNESIQETDTTPVKEDSISTNNDSISKANKKGITQNPFKRSNKRKRYSIVGKLDTSSACSDKQSDTVDVQHSETIFSPHNLQVTKENAKHNPFMKVNLRRFSFNATLDISDVSNVNEPDINENRIEENPEIQKCYQPNLLTSGAIQEDLSMKNDENVEVEISASVQQCSEFNEILVSQNDSVKIKDQSQEITNNVENLAMHTITTIAESHAREEPMTEIPTESMQIPRIETSKVGENSSEGILQFVEIGKAASQNVDKSELLPNNQTASFTSLSSDINLENRAETKDGDTEDSKENDAPEASNENVPTTPDERCIRDEVVLNNTLSPHISNTTVNSICAVTGKRNDSLPTNSEIDGTGQISLESTEIQVERILLEREHKIESNHKKPSNISEEESTPQSKKSHAALSDDVENLSVSLITTIAEIHSYKESDSESCTEPQDQKVEYGSNEARENKGQEIAQIMEIGTSASQKVYKNGLLTKGTDSSNSSGSHVNSENMAEPNDANERNEREIYLVDEAQTRSDGDVPISPGVGMASTLLDGSVEDETLLLKNTYSEGTSLPVINESFIDQLKSGMDDGHLLPIFCTKTSVKKGNTANDTNNSQNSSWANQTFTKNTSDQSRTKEYELSSSLDSTLNTSGNKVQDIINTNPFKKPRDKKVKTSFALDTTQEENVSFEEEQQKYNQVESKTNPFKKNLKRKNFSVRLEKTFDSSNESIHETDTTPVKEDSISTNNDSTSKANKKGITQNPFKRSNKRKRYSVVGTLDTSSACSDKQSESVDVQRSITCDASNENDSNKGIEDNTGIQQLNQPNLSTSAEIEEDLLMKNSGNVEVEINASAQKCSEFNENLVSQNDSIKIKEQSQENLAVCTITTLAEIHSQDEPMIEISTESMQMLSIEAAEFIENSREEILHFIETGTDAPLNVDKNELLPNNETNSCPLLSSDINSENRAETEDANFGDEVEDSKEDSALVASNENILTSADERYTPDEVVVNNILAVSDERNNSLPANSKIYKTGQMSPESNQKKSSNISREETAPLSKQPHAALSDDVENLSVCIVTSIAEVHSYKEYESGGCTELSGDQKVESGSIVIKGNNGEELETMEIGKPASQNFDKNELLTNRKESCNSSPSHVHSGNKAESNDANEKDKNEIHKEAELQTGSNGNEPGVGMVSTPLNGSVEDETLLLKNTYSEGTSLPVINEPFINQLKSGMDDSHRLPIFCTKTSVKNGNTANENNSQNSSWTNQTFTKNTTDNSRTKEHELSSSSLDSTLNTSGNKVQDIINTNPFKNTKDKKVKISFALDTTQEENVSFEEELQKYKQVESKTNPFKKNLTEKKFSVRFERTVDHSDESIHETDTTPVKEDSISTNNDGVIDENKDCVAQNSLRMTNQSGKYSIMGKLDTSDTSSDKKSETVDVQRFVKSDASSVKYTDINVKEPEHNTEKQELNQPNLSTSVEINVSAQKCSEFNESLVTQNDSIKIREPSQENLAVCTITTIAEIHSQDEPMTEIFTESTQVLSIEASEFSENSSEEILRFIEIETDAPLNVDKSELLPNNETNSSPLLSSDINSENRAETEDANVEDEVEDSKEDSALVASNENIITSTDERCTRDEVVADNILAVSDEMNNSLPANSKIHKTGQISPESNHKKPSNISKEETAPLSKQPHATLNDDVENLSVCIVTTIAEVHSYKEYESRGCTELTGDQKVESGSNEARENNGEEILQIIEVGTSASQNVDKNELLTKGTDSSNSLPLHGNYENKAEPNDANERDKKEIHKEAEAQLGSDRNVPISPDKQCLDDEPKNIRLGNNLLLSSSSNAIIACAPQLSEKKEIEKDVEKNQEFIQVPCLTEDEIPRNEEKSKTGTNTMSMISEAKNNISAQRINKIHLLPTPPPGNVEDNDELAVEQSRVYSPTGNGPFLEDERDLNKDDGKRAVRRKSPRIAGLSVNKSNEVINTSKNTSTKHRKASKNLREINISPALMERKSKGDVDKEINVSINIASSEASPINLNCKPDKKSVETNVSNLQKMTSRNQVSKIRKNECQKDLASELINDECNHDSGGTDNQAVDSNKQQLSDSGRTRKKNSRNISIVKSVLKSNTERNEGVAISKRQTPLKDINKIITESSKHSSKEKEKPPDSFTIKSNNDHFGELSLSFDVSAIPNDKLISSKKRKYKSTPLVQRLSRSKRLSVNVLLQNENRKNPLGDNLSTISASKDFKETKKVLKEKTLNSANDFEFAAPKLAPRKSSITAVKRPRRSVTFRPHSSLIPPQDDSKKSRRGDNGRKFSIDVQTSLGKKSKNSMDQNSCKVVSADVSSKHNSKKIERNSAVDKKNKDLSYETTLEVSEIALHTPKQRKRLLFHSTPKNRITSLRTPSLAEKPKRPSDNQETPCSSSSLYSTTETDADQSDSYTPTVSRTLRNSSSHSSSNKNVMSYNSHTCMATRIAATSAHQSRQDNSDPSAQSGTKTTSSRSVESCNSEVLLEESSCFNRPPDDSFSTSYSGVNESVRARSVLEKSAIIVETQERKSLRNGTMHMTLRSSRTTFQHSAIYSETQLSEITQSTVNESNLVSDKSLSLISKFSKNKKKKDSVFGNVEKKKVIPHSEPLPKLAKPAKWIKKELYAFLEKKLGTKYKLEKRYHCERLVLILHNAVINTLMGHPELSLLTLKEELINNGICKTQIDYFTFLHRFTPLEFIKKIVPLGRAYGNEDFKYKKIVAYSPLE